MRRIAAPLLAFGLLALGCTGPSNPTTDRPAQGSGSSGSGATAAAPDWHATDSLFAVMGGVQGRVVADLFAGDGYYTLKLLEAGAKVVAIDTDPAALQALEAKAKEKGYGPDKLIVRTTTEGNPGLLVGEVDRALCTKPFLTIQDRVPFFSAVKAGLAPKGQLIIVDFLQEQTPMGPPMDLRVPLEQVMDELEPCGFTDIGGYSKKLPYRFIIQAMEFDPGPMDGQ